MSSSTRTGQTVPVTSRHSSLFLVLAIVLSLPLPAVADNQPAGTVQTATGPTQVLLFDMSPLADYDVTHNGADAGSRTADVNGVLEFDGTLSSGDRLTITWTGVTPVDAGVPTGFAATGDDAGCVTVTWDEPPSSELISGYVLLWGTRANVYSDSAAFDLNAVNRTSSTWSHLHCGLAEGTYFFALRAHNQFDRYSAPTPAVEATISNGNAQAPAPPQNVAASEDTPGCAEVTWSAVSDPNVTGYRLHYGTRSVAGGQASSYENAVTVSAGVTATACQLPEGMHYFAVTSLAGGLESGFSQEVSLDILGADVTGPTVSSTRPVNGATGVATNSNVFFVVVDDKSQIDVEGLVLKINDVTTPVSYSESNGGYFVQTSTLDLPGDTDISCEVTVADKPAGNTTVYAWSFRTGSEPVVDSDAPVVLPVYPADGQTDVAPDVEVVIRLRDAGVGVRLGTIVVTVDDVPVNATVTGTPDEVTIRYTPQNPFPSGATIHIGVDACDEATPVNCTDRFELAFTVAQDVYAGLPAGAIVPDGYWADDPARPLQVRNLPRNWVVRIFDASGSPVRRFRNTLADDYVWTWDFRNDRGRKVGRALYLIRVTDESGSVQRSGRFLVQQDP